MNLPIPKYLEVNIGDVYIIKVGDYIKIGRSTNALNRFKQYESFPPFTIDILLHERVIDYKFYERALQNYLIEYQIKGEWFDLPKYTPDYKDILLKEFKRIDKQVKDDDVFPGYWNRVKHLLK